MFDDDNEWVALAKVQQYLMNGDEAALERAKEIFELVDSGWVTDASHPAPGVSFARRHHGVWIAIRFLRGPERSGECDCTKPPVTSTIWTRRLNTSNGRMRTCSHRTISTGVKIMHDGSMDKTHWPNNQGVPIGMSALLY